LLKQAGRSEGRPLIAGEWTELTVIGIMGSSEGANLVKMRAAGSVTCNISKMMPNRRCCPAVDV
jgi:hypothetical protein